MKSLIEIENKLKEMFEVSQKANCAYCIYKEGYKNLYEKYKKLTPDLGFLWAPFYCSQHITKAFK